MMAAATHQEPDHDARPGCSPRKTSGWNEERVRFWSREGLLSPTIGKRCAAREYLPWNRYRRQKEYCKNGAAESPASRARGKGLGVSATPLYLRITSLSLYLLG